MWLIPRDLVEGKMNRHPADPSPRHPEQVRQEVRERIAQLGPEGFILAPSHVLQPNVNPTNIVAMYEEVRTAGRLLT